MILEERYCNEEPNKIKHHRIPHNSKDLRHQRNPRALNPPDRTGLRICVYLCNLWDLKRINFSFERRQVQSDTAMKNKEIVEKMVT